MTIVYILLGLVGYLLLTSIWYMFFCYQTQSSTKHWALRAHILSVLLGWFLLFVCGIVYALDSWVITPIKHRRAGYKGNIDQGDISRHEIVDLGLPSGTLWADQDFSYYKDLREHRYFSWGELTSKDNYESQSSAWCNFADKCGECSKRGATNTANSWWKRLSCKLDRKLLSLFFPTKHLPLKRDVANVVLGKGWCIPSKANWEELRDCCTWEWLPSDDNHYYERCRVVGPNGNAIFFEIEGLCISSRYPTEGTTHRGAYWSSDACDSCFAWQIDIQKDNVFIVGKNRYMGLKIHPIFKPQTPQPQSLTFGRYD